MTPLVVVLSVAAALAVFALLVRAMATVDSEWRGIVNVTIPPATPVVLGASLQRNTGIYAIDPLPGTPIATLADHVAAARARGVRQIAISVDLFEQMCSIAKHHDVLLRNESAK